MTDQGKY